ncbi:MAG: Methenyltetrahydromethanopterin cyclohydrolase [Planctomycetota bacterium]|jgi:methenyltetrahydromethanopterin cyclohydrolase
MTLLTPALTHLNQRAASLLEVAAADPLLRIRREETPNASIVDFGVIAEGGLEAGLALARICLSGLAEVTLTPPAGELPLPLPAVTVRSDFPLEACLLSQYAGCRLQTGDYFAMGSGPLRAVLRREELIQEFTATEDGSLAVGVFETGSLPPAAALEALREGLPSGCRLLVAAARTASQAGTLQVVARSLETALHKLHSLNFPLQTIVSGMGTAPLPPVAKNDLAAIGRTNDAILYGGIVNLWVRCDDELLSEIGPRVPSCSSASFGQTFLSLFKAANYDFYAMDAALFSPAVVVFHNLRSGRSFRFGQLNTAVLAESCGC